jgi:GDP-L-fucose synthase
VATGNLITRSRAELDLLDQRAVHAFLAAEQPDYIFIAAAKVGGIHANNTYRAEFMYQNLMIESQPDPRRAWRAGVQRLMFLGSSCIYPRDCPQPIREDYLLTGRWNPPTSRTPSPRLPASSSAKPTTASTARQYISAMPTNLYGPNDNYDLANSHVLPALIRKAHEASARQDRELWSGAPASQSASFSMWTTWPMPVCS